MYGIKVTDKHASLYMNLILRDYKKANVILDIDEDYFGVEFPSNDISNSALPHLEVLSNISSYIICNVNKRGDEGKANNILRNVVKEMLKLCSPNNMNNLEMCPIQLSLEASNTLRTIKSSLVCNNNKFFKRLVLKFASTLQKLRIVELRQVLDIGWCRAQPIGVNYTASVRLCPMKADPRFQFVHTPTKLEFNRRARQLAKIFRHIHSITPPSLVTLSRSTRDGYTPRRLAAQIESAILNAFTALSPRYVVHYDEYLWGGKIGWSNRHNVL